MDKNQPSETTFLFLGALRIPVLRVMVGAAVTYVASIGRLLHFEDKEIYQLEMAVEEAVGNAVIHYAADLHEVPDTSILIECMAGEGNLIISVREKGIPYDHRATQRYDTDSLENMQRPGLGEFLLHKVMDKVEWIEHGREGKEIRLTKALRYGQLPQELLDQVKPTRRKARVTVRQAEIREVTLEDLPELCRLAWRCYGYTQEDLLYDLNTLTEKVASGTLRSIVAFDPDSGNMIGHMGLKYHDDAGVPELGLAFIDPAYRCPGLSGEMSQVIAQLARDSGAKAIFDCSVTTHIYSQKANQDVFGSTPCCIMLGIAARGMQAKDLTTTTQEKGSVVNHFLPFDRTPADIYPPLHHSEIIKDLYAWMEMPRTCIASAQTALTGDSQTFIVPLPDELNVAFIIVNKVGAASIDEIRDGLRQCRREKRDAVYAFLPLNDPACPLLTDACEACGFFFAGIMPHIHNGGDRLLLQYLDIPLDTDAIRVYGPRSAQLFAYIKNEQQRVTV